MRIHAALMTQNELPDLYENLQRLEPHVHTITIVDGGSTDGTIPFMRNWAQTPGGAKVRLFIHPWKDNFPEQRNNYLKRVGEIAKDGDWVLTFDPDEFLDQDARDALPTLIQQAEERNFHRIGFQCRSVSLKGPHRVHETLDEYRKGLLYRWNPKLHYGHDGDGPVHETLRGLYRPDMMLGQTPGTRSYCYEHRKQENVIWPRGLRNMFMGGGGPNLGHKNQKWVQLREWVAANLGIPFELGQKGHWATFHAYLLRGNIDPWLKAWLVEASKERDWDGSSEMREAFKTVYRMYHPDQEPEEMRGVHIP